MLVGPKKNPVEILTPEDIAKLPQQEQHKWERPPSTKAR